MNKTLDVDVPLIKARATRIVKVWKASRDFRMKDATAADFEALHNEFERVLKDIAAKSRELDELRKVRARVAVKLRVLCTRAQGGMCAYFGPNSPQFQQLTVPITVERRKNTRKSKPAAALPGESTGTKP